MGKINLDKICAEYGIDLLNLPNKLYAETNQIIKKSLSLTDFQNTNYSLKDWDEKCKKFFEYNLINPLKTFQKKIKNENEFFSLKNKLISLDVRSYETEITKALGILVEDGPFAYLIWLKSQDKEPHRAMIIQTACLLEKVKLIDKIEPSKDLEIEKIFLENITDDIPKLILAKTLLEKMLIYARYKAKAMQREAGEE